MNPSLRIVWGIALGMLVGWVAARMFFWPSTTIHKGPSSRRVQSTVFEHDGKFYQFEAVPHVCPPSIDPDCYEHSSDDEDLSSE